MGVLLALLIPIIALAIMTPAMRTLSICVFLGSLAYGLWVKFGQDRYEPSTQQLGILMTLYGLNIGLLVLGTIIGLIKSSCKTQSEYISRRNIFFKFLAVWGLPFLALKQILVLYIDSETGESGSGAFLTGLMGSYLFVAYIIIAIIARLIYRGLTGR